MLRTRRDVTSLSRTEQLSLPLATHFANLTQYKQSTALLNYGTHLIHLVLTLTDSLFFPGRAASSRPSTNSRLLSSSPLPTSLHHPTTTTTYSSSSTFPFHQYLDRASHPCETFSYRVTSGVDDDDDDESNSVDLTTATLSDTEDKDIK